MKYHAHRRFRKADSIRSDAQFGAKLGMQFKTPTLLLEDIEHHVETIACSKDGIHLHFLSEESLAHAHEEFRNVNAFFLISSHEGCNADGERDPYL